MDIFSVFKLLGGLAMFLYGMSILSNGLEKASGGRLEKTLEKLSDNLFKSITLGAVVTAAVQSSSATTVIVVGLVNSKILGLKQAIGVIMGANIGTTITAHILRLSSVEGGGFFLNLIKPTSFAPLMIAIGFLIYTIAKRTQKKELGHVLIGFGILFTGMTAMSDAVAPLSEMPEFIGLFSMFKNPVLGVLVGAIVTAAIQSSAASIGILQALTATGQISYASAIPIILGQNVGTCITSILAAIGASKGAKRAAVVHLSFNILGSAIFLAAVYGINAISPLSFWNDPILPGGIANVHTVFNLSITLLFIPFVNLLDKMAYKIVKDDKDDILDNETALSLDDRLLVSPGLALNHTKKVILAMGKLAYENYVKTMTLFDTYDMKRIEGIKERENVIDMLEDKANAYLLRLSAKDLSSKEGAYVSELLRLVSEVERIGDYTINITECAQDLYEDKAVFSQTALEEMKTIGDAVEEIIIQAITSISEQSADSVRAIEPLEEIVDDMQEYLKERHVERLKQNSCTWSAAFPFVETLNNLERIADHCSNIGMHVLTNASGGQTIDRHEYRRQLHLGEYDFYQALYEHYDEKYLKKIEELTTNK